MDNNSADEEAPSWNGADIAVEDACPCLPAGADRNSDNCNARSSSKSEDNSDESSDELCSDDESSDEPCSDELKSSLELFEHFDKGAVTLVHSELFRSGAVRVISGAFPALTDAMLEDDDNEGLCNAIVVEPRDNVDGDEQDAPLETVAFSLIVMESPFSLLLLLHDVTVRHGLARGNDDESHCIVFDRFCSEQQFVLSSANLCIVQ